MLFGLFSPGAAKAAPCSLQEDEGGGGQSLRAGHSGLPGAVRLSAVMQAWPALGGRSTQLPVGLWSQGLERDRRSWQENKTSPLRHVFLLIFDPF